jgi:hypothetical protein
MILSDTHLRLGIFVEVLVPIYSAVVVHHPGMSHFAYLGAEEQNAGTVTFAGKPAPK